MSDSVETLVVGAGQAGLAAGHVLAAHDLEHLVVDRDRVSGRWRSERWDSLAFQFPNWSLQLPGKAYEGPNPEGFADHTDVCAFLESYALRTEAHLRTGLNVESLRATDDGYRAQTSSGSIDARNVILATGPFQRPRLPRMARKVPRHIMQVHSSRYRNPEQLPTGGVLIVGSGGSGGQIAEELLDTGRKVFLALSRHRRVPRRRHGRDLLWWLLEMGWMDRPVASLPGGRIPPTLLITGVHGGHDLDLRRMREQGLMLLGRLRDVNETTLWFHDDAVETLADADAGFTELVSAIDRHAREGGLDLWDDDGQAPVGSFTGPIAVELDLASIASIVWCTGYSFDYDWVDVPGIVDGVPIQQRGVSTPAGLYFLGLHWMHTFKSGTLFGVGDDAAYLADQIDARRR